MIFRTSSAVPLAIAFADSAKRRRAIGFVVFDDASLAALHNIDVFFAIVVAIGKIFERIIKKKQRKRIIVKKRKEPKSMNSNDSKFKSCYKNVRNYEFVCIDKF